MRHLSGWSLLPLIQAVHTLRGEWGVSIPEIAALRSVNVITVQRESLHAEARGLVERTSLGGLKLTLAGEGLHWRAINHVLYREGA